jgi:hypothetical protein
VPNSFNAHGPRIAQRSHVFLRTSKCTGRRRDTQMTKPSAVRSQRLCLRPPYVPLRHRWVVEPAVQALSEPSLFVPTLQRGTSSSTSQSYGRVTAFLRPRSAYRAFAVEKGRPQHPSAEMSGPGSALVFGRPFGDERRLHHRFDANNVTHSGKICDAPSSPRFALFYMATL